VQPIKDFATENDGTDKSELFFGVGAEERTGFGDARCLVRFGDRIRRYDLRLRARATWLACVMKPVSPRSASTA
jgi:hypothetical protein